MARFLLLLPMLTFLAVACDNTPPENPDGGEGGADAGSTTDGGTDGGVATWDQAVERDAQALCQYDEVCAANADGMTLEACKADVTQDYTDARAQIQDELDCIDCMRIRDEELEGAINSNCATMPNQNRIRAACGQNKQTCAGAP